MQTSLREPRTEIFLLHMERSLALALVGNHKNQKGLQAPARDKISSLFMVRNHKTITSRMLLREIWDYF